MSAMLSRSVLLCYCFVFAVAALEDLTPTSEVPTLPPPLTTRSPEGSNINGPPCQCYPLTSYNDVMILVENTVGMGTNGLMEVLGTAASELDNFNVLKASEGNVNNSTRVGMITYSSTATLVNPLGSIGQSDIDTLPFSVNATNDKYTNLNQAINIAIAEFYGPNARPHSRKVMLVLASVYWDAGFEDPAQAADQFESNLDGIVIAYDYIQEFGIPSPKLIEVASDGYFLSSWNSTSGDEITQALCDANCYCHKSSQMFQKSMRDTPTAGCYAPVTTVANFNLASSICRISRGGYVATARTNEKALFLNGSEHIIRALVNITESCQGRSMRCSIGQQRTGVEAGAVCHFL